VKKFLMVRSNGQIGELCTSEWSRVRVRRDSSLLTFAFVPMGMLPTMAVQLILLGRGDDGAASVTGLFLLAYIAGCLLLWRKPAPKPGLR
jgi:hypothetical protein